MALATVNAVWVGPELGPLHAACLRSFKRQGHTVRLHVYERPRDVPEGIELASAQDLLPEGPALHEKGIPLAVVSDLMRYEILAREYGLYVDCDVFCLRPFEDTDFLFGFEADTLLGNAVLKFPSDSPIVRSLASMRHLDEWPPWVPDRQPWPSAQAPDNSVLRILPWGAVGPSAVTHFAKKYELISKAQPLDVLYPVPFTRTKLLLDPELTIADIVTPRTIMIHCWNEMLRRAKPVIPASSPLGQMIASP